MGSQHWQETEKLCFSNYVTFCSPHHCNIDNLSSILKFLILSYTNPSPNPAEVLSRQSEASHFCFHGETRAIRRTPSNSCQQNNNASLSICVSSFLPSCFRGRNDLSLMTSSYLLLSCIFKPPLSTGSFPSVCQHLLLHIPSLSAPFISSTPFHFTTHHIPAISLKKNSPCQIHHWLPCCSIQSTFSVFRLFVP